MHPSLLLQNTSRTFLYSPKMRLKLLPLAWFSPPISPIPILLMLEKSLQQLGLGINIILQVRAIHILASPNLPQHFLKLQRRLTLRQPLTHINKAIQQLTLLPKIARLRPHPIQDELCDCIEVTIEGELLGVEVDDMGIVGED